MLNKVSLIQKLKTSFVKLRRRMVIDGPTRNFINFNKAKWGQPPNEKSRSVILVDMFDTNPTFYCFSVIAQHLARSTSSSLAAFHFAKSHFSDFGLKERRLEKIFNSFGIPLKLSLYSKEVKKFEAEANEFAEKVFSSLKNKWDVIEISIDGVQVGQLICDSYLKLGHSTLDLKDKKLKAKIKEAYLIFKVSEEFFKNHSVKAMLTSHAVYNSHGIIVRLAAKHNVPVYVLFDHDALQIVEIKPDTYYHWPYERYQSLFAKFSEAEKLAHRESARKLLNARLSGNVDRGIADNLLEEGRPGFTGYGPAAATPLTRSTGRPKILLMLNCFMDAPHCYRAILFPDFWEWVCYTLEAAKKTDFDWYVKPHPAGLPANDRVLEELKVKFPNVTFLGRKASNKQLIDEGINAMFTVYGTAAHEFAYMGIPVVTAGDNPQVNYNFNIHAKSVEEFKKLVLSADKLKVDLDKSKIEEFFFMHFINCYQKNDFDARIIDEEFEYARFGYKVNQTSMLDNYIRTETSEKDKKVKAYLDQYFAALVKGDQTEDRKYSDVDKLIEAAL